MPPGFTAAMMLKDLRLAQQAAGASAAPTPMGAAAAALYQLFVDEGAGGSISRRSIALSPNLTTKI